MAGQFRIYTSLLFILLLQTCGISAAVSQQVSPDSANGTKPVNEVNTAKAWDCINRNDWNSAITNADLVIGKFSKLALGQQDELNQRIQMHLEGTPPLGRPTKEQFAQVNSRGVLNDVATCYYIECRAYYNIYAETKSEDPKSPQLEDITGKFDAARQKCQQLSLARCWDPNTGLFWSPATACENDFGPSHLNNWVSWGDVDWRDNNFAGRTASNGLGGIEDYRSHYIGESFNRFLLTKWDVQPYVELDASYTSGQVSQENVVQPGIGLQWYPFSASQSPSLPPWVKSARLYALYSGQWFLRFPNPEWNPRSNILAGFDSWTESGLSPNDRTWSELFVGAAYYSTDFYIPAPSKGGVHAGADLRYGPYVDSDHQIKPYAVLDANWDTQSYYWQNRIWGGVGVRWEFPLRNGNRWWVYAEQRWILNYPRTSPPPTDQVAYHDTWIGISYEFNLYNSASNTNKSHKDQHSGQ